MLTLSAPAKVNLSLRILAKRADGFHALETRMVPISVTDQVTLAWAEETTLTCSDASLPVDESNLAMKALRGFERRSGIVKPVHIHLEKHIPHGAGLGGGSSDAAAALRGLNQLHAEPLTRTELCEIAAGLGSDIPFFLYEGACDAAGRGEVIAPIDFPHALELVLIKPPFGIPTPWAYQNWASSKELEGVRYAAQSMPWGEMVNDLERPAFAKHYHLAALKMWLLDQPESAAALMSGSGSTMFAVVKAGESAQALAERVQAYAGESAWVRVARTL